MARNAPLRVLHVLPTITLTSGGVATSVTNLSRALQSLGVEVSIYATDAAMPANAPHRHFGVQPTDLPPGADELEIQLFNVCKPQRWLYSPSLRREIRATLSGYDAIHIHGLFLYPQFAAWREATRMGTPYVVSTHGMLLPFLRKRGSIQRRISTATWVRSLLNGASAVTCLAESELSGLSLRSRHLEIPNVMHLDDFMDLPDPAEFRQQFLAGSNAPLVLNHGRLSFKKGLDILIDAMVLVRQQHPDAILALVGPDTEGLKAQLQAQADQRNLGDAVIFTGQLTGMALRSALAATDVWALPSHADGFAYAVAEAMAVGLPVVASSEVHIAPTAQQEQALQMVDVDVRSTANAINELLDDPVRRRAIGDRGRQFVTRYDWRNVGRQFVELYGQIAGKA